MNIQEVFISHNEGMKDPGSQIRLISNAVKKLFFLLIIILGNFTGNHGFAKSPLDDKNEGWVVKATKDVQKKGEAMLHRLPAPPPDSSRPNIILIVLDDCRYDTYSCNGAPAFVQTPNIDRIANEGVNFKNSFVTFSLCVPSRASILTGLYANHHGTINNKNWFDTSLLTIASVLNQSGYYTAFLGKYLNSSADPQPGWDFWMARDGSGHQNASFNYNGIEQDIDGHVTDVLTDTALAIMKRAPRPFLIDICYTTHPPYFPRYQEAQLYEDVEMPFPKNYYPYNINFPDFYDNPYFLAKDSATLQSQIRGYYQVMVGIDKSISKMFNTMENKGFLDSTCIIFTSDNGYLLGEHYLQGKRLPPDESIRVPMFIRYPEWFPPNSIVDSQMVLNVDIARTLFELAEVPDTIKTDGVSMRGIFDKTIKRTSYYYQASHLNDSSVNCRSVRSLQYKYNYYYCDQFTEEFFDLKRDPAENINLINELNYQYLIQDYREKMDSFRIALEDTLPDEMSDCYLANATTFCCLDTVLEINLVPNPSSGFMKIVFPLIYAGQVADCSIVNQLGMIQYQNSNLMINDQGYIPVYMSNIPDGIYFLQIRIKEISVAKKFLIVENVSLPSMKRN